MILVLVDVVIGRWGPEKWFRRDGIYRPIAADAPVPVKIFASLSAPALLVGTVCGFCLFVIIESGKN